MSKIRLVETTGSTNADLLEMRDAVEGDWLVARFQTAGRGRQGRDWQTIDGNFFGSTLIELRDGDPPAATLSLMAGLALLEAVESVSPDADLQLKWPNDLLLGGAKLAGILLERAGNRVVAGFGVNLAGAPEIEGRDIAHLGAPMAPQAFAPLLAGAVTRLLAAWRNSDPSAFTMAWMQRAHPVGTKLSIHDTEGEPISGRFAGIDEDGALRLEREGGEVVRIHAGDVLLDSPVTSG